MRTLSLILFLILLVLLAWAPAALAEDPVPPETQSPDPAVRGRAIMREVSGTLNSVR